jgi:hypothetical protein
VTTGGELIFTVIQRWTHCPIYSSLELPIDLTAGHSPFDRVLAVRLQLGRRMLLELEGSASVRKSRP